jgi:uncharacterized protein
MVNPTADPRASGRVDAHVHLTQWWPDLRRTAHRPDLDYSVSGLLRAMDRHRIGHALAIQMFTAPSEEAALAEGGATYSASAGRLLPVATVDPTPSDTAVEVAVERLEREATLFGIKLYPGYRPFYPNDRRLHPLFEFAARRRLPVLLHQGDTLDGMGLLRYARPLDVDEVAGQFREVSFVLCHLGNPWVDEAMEVVYKNRNVYADTSGLLPHPTRPYFERSVEHAREVLRTAVVASSAPERILYGSDWPLEDLGVATERVESLPVRAEDIAAILGGNAARLFRIPPTD